MEFVELFSHMGKLFETFKGWSILLIVGVTLLMIPINMLLKKWMKKENLSRLRKTLAMLLVYVLSLGVVALFTAIATKTNMTAYYLFGSTMSLGFCSQFLWLIIKFVRDYGWSAIKVILENSSWKKMVSSITTKYSVPNSVVDAVFTTIDDFLAQIETDKAETFIANEMSILSNVQMQLKGFTTDNTEEIAKSIVELVKTNILGIKTTADSENKEDANK